MFVRLRRGESSQTFNIWVYGDSTLARGSGVFVGENGVVCNHHFLLPADGTSYDFRTGKYTLEVYASLVGSEGLLKLFTTDLEITNELGERLKDPDNGIYFDWGCDSHRRLYTPGVEESRSRQYS